jgi:hypothetical protein
LLNFSVLTVEVIQVMLKTEALVFLVNSMTQHEKKAFKISSQQRKTSTAYLSLFNIISKNRIAGSDSVKIEFLANNRKASFDASVKYLYKILLDTLLDLRKEQDSYYTLFNSIMKARVLFEKSLFENCFELLEKIKADAKKFENYYALLLASKLELEYLLALNFPLLDEKTLLNKHYRINEILSFIRKIHEQSSLYELLKYRVDYIGNVRSPQQKLNLNDLVVSEMSILASSNLENFEISKLHQLFQANYLISVGDFKSALRSYVELSSLFENNKHLWSNPPIYYLLTLEGVLDSLRSIRNYEGMQYFIQQLKKLESPSVNFNANAASLVFLYELFPKLDKGDFTSASLHLEKHLDTLYSKMNLLNLPRQAELNLYAALIYFGRKDYKRAHKFLSMVTLKGKDFYSLLPRFHASTHPTFPASSLAHSPASTLPRLHTSMPLYRTIRLVNLMILNEIGDFHLISYETRSMKREMKDIDKGYQIEKTMLSFLNKQNMPVTIRKREKLWEKVSGELELLRNDIFEKQVLRIFDFTAWIESKIRRIPLNEVLGMK